MVLNSVRTKSNHYTKKEKKKKKKKKRRANITATTKN